MKIWRLLFSQCKYCACLSLVQYMQPQSWERLLSWQLSRWSSTPSPRKASHRKSLVKKKLAVPRVLHESILMVSWLRGEKCGRKSNWDDHSLESKVEPRNWVNFTRSGQRLVLVHQEPTKHSLWQRSYNCHIHNISHILNQRQYQRRLMWLRRKRTGLLLRGTKSSFQVKVEVYLGT